MTIQFLCLMFFFLMSKRVESEPLQSVLSPEGQDFLMGSIAQTDNQSSQEEGRFVAEDNNKVVSPGRAFLSSILIPGLGQLLAGDTVRGAIFSGIELAALGMYLNWNGKGKDTENEFRKDMRNSKKIELTQSTIYALTWA